MRDSDPLDQQIDDFARYLRDERRSSARTVETYVRDLRSFADYVRAEDLPPDARKLDIVALRGFLSSLFRSNQASTMKKKVSAMRSFFKFLVKRQVVEVNPASGLRSPKVPKGLPRFLTVDQAFRVMEAPPKEDKRAKPLRARDRALVGCLPDGAQAWPPRGQSPPGATLRPSACLIARPRPWHSAFDRLAIDRGGGPRCLLSSPKGVPLGRRRSYCVSRTGRRPPKVENETYPWRG